MFSSPHSQAPSLQSHATVYSIPDVPMRLQESCQAVDSIEQDREHRSHGESSQLLHGQQPMTIATLNCGSSPLFSVPDNARLKPDEVDTVHRGSLHAIEDNRDFLPRVARPYSFPWPTPQQIPQSTDPNGSRIAKESNDRDFVAVPPLLGRVFGNDWSLRNSRNRSTVLAHETIWCLDPDVIHRPIARWPCWSEFQWEGDMRASSENGHFRRMLPLPRLPAHWPGYHPDYKENGVVPPSPFDKTFQIPTEEDIVAPVDEIPDKIADHLIRNSLLQCLALNSMVAMDTILEHCVRDILNATIDLRMSSAFQVEHRGLGIFR